MRWVFGLRTVLVLWLLLPAAVAAEEGEAAGVGPADRSAIRTVIEDQLAAFGRDDGEAAFSFASPSIRARFGSAESFMAMVRGGYPDVYRPQSVAFEKLVLAQGTLLQLVRVVGPDGVPKIAAYEMERQPDGSWRINGCALLGLAERTT